MSKLPLIVLYVITVILTALIIAISVFASIYAYSVVGIWGAIVTMLAIAVIVAGELAK